MSENRQGPFGIQCMRALDYIRERLVKLERALGNDIGSTDNARLLHRAIEATKHWKQPEFSGRFGEEDGVSDSKERLWDLVIRVCFGDAAQRDKVRCILAPYAAATEHVETLRREIDNMRRALEEKNSPQTMGLMHGVRIMGPRGRQKVPTEDERAAVEGLVGEMKIAFEAHGLSLVEIRTVPRGE